MRPLIPDIGAQRDAIHAKNLECVGKKQQFALYINESIPHLRSIPSCTNFDAMVPQNNVQITGAADKSMVAQSPDSKWNLLANFFSLKGIVKPGVEARASCDN